MLLRFVVVETADEIGPGWRERYRGQFKPTPTPIPQPAGDCFRTPVTTLDLADRTGARTIEGGPLPERYDVGHALVVTNATATYRNGSRVTTMRGAGGVRAHVVEGVAAGPYRVTLRVETVDGAGNDYWLIGDATGQ